MRAYTVFADMYDKFMKDIPYDEWARRITACLEEHGIKDGRLLELGCGTGRFTRLMAERGYSVTGTDISPDMLRQARRRLAGSGLEVRLEQQDMRALETDAVYRAVVSVCDSVNYLRSVFDLESMFEGAATALERGGIFIFDMKTESFYRSLGDSVFTDEADGDRYIWENDYDEATRDNVYYMTFYAKSLFGMYRRYTEEHIQHAFTDGEVQNAARAKGFRIEGVYGMRLLGEADWNAERVYYVMERN